MTFHPHTADESRAMLQAIGVGSFDEMYPDVPERVRFPQLDLPAAASEMEILEEVAGMAANNRAAPDLDVFLGAGAYHHFIPAAVDHILQRSEFYTAYTPYQPEISQGTLQAIFEFQSHICRLTGMDAANASVYDGATALAEAVNLALVYHRQRRSRIVLAPTLHPQAIETAATYLRGAEVELVGPGQFQQGLDDLIRLVDDNTALVAFQYPDFLGHINDYRDLSQAAHEAGALVCAVVNPIALGLLQPPSEFGADIVVGEGQPLGIPLSFGGPYLGLFAVTEALVRKLPGRLVGETKDVRGQRGYVLTLTPREQHIRRERATSNICTNQGLMALAAAVYLSLMGKHGIRQVAELCYHKAHYAADQIAQLDGYDLWNKRQFFHEFVIATPAPVAEINSHLLERGIVGGYDLGQWSAEFEQHMLLAVTERNSRESIDRLVLALEAFDRG